MRVRHVAPLHEAPCKLTRPTPHRCNRCGHAPLFSRSPSYEKYVRSRQLRRPRARSCRPNGRSSVGSSFAEAAGAWAISAGWCAQHTPTIRAALAARALAEQPEASCRAGTAACNDRCMLRKPLRGCRASHDQLAVATAAPPPPPSADVNSLATAAATQPLV